MKRRCIRCDVLKAVRDFGTRKKVLKKTCKVCCSKAVVSYYASNSSYRKACKEGRRRRCLERQTFIYKYLLEHPCVDCGEPDTVVLQFDHSRGKKYLCVTSMTLFGLKRFLQEVSKCDVRCANCHARRTAKRANTPRWKLSKKENT